MKVSYLLLISFLIVGMLCIPAVSAETIIDEEFTEYEFTGGARSSDAYMTSGGKERPLDAIRFADITRHSLVNYISLEMKNDNEWGYLEEGRTERTYTLGGRTDTASVYIQHNRNLLGRITSTRFDIFPYHWDITGLSGQQVMIISPALVPTKWKCYGIDNSWDNDIAWPSSKQFNVIGIAKQGFGGYSIVVSSSNKWQNHLTVESVDNDLSYQINLKREYDSKSHYSKIDVKQGDDIIVSDYDRRDFSYLTLKSQINSLAIHSPTTTYNRLLGDISGDPGDDPVTADVTVYIKNSQTGALIANSNIVIDALVNGEYYPVVNRTEPSGIFSINLQPTGGGHPNPDGYRLIVTADGYNNPMPEINFTVDDYKQSIYCLLDPIAGGPADENKTFIDFFVSDMYANPIPGATVKFDKYTLITNSAGYTVFEVPKNDYYTYTVSKSGYNTITGNANIGDAPRNTINTYLTPVITPPTQPTGWPTDPPTQPTGGIPDEDDDSDGFMMQAVRGIANLFGVSFGVGKTILGMLLALGIGTATAKQLKGGAQEFGMGMLGGVVLGVLIGLLPIWVLVLLVLIVGLWIGQRYMSGGDS